MSDRNGTNKDVTNALEESSELFALIQNAMENMLEREELNENLVNAIINQTRRQNSKNTEVLLDNS